MDTVFHYVQVRPVTRSRYGGLIRAFGDAPVEKWGVYLTDADGLPMWVADRSSREAAIEVARSHAAAMRRPVIVDELDGTETTIKRLFNEGD